MALKKLNVQPIQLLTMEDMKTADGLIKRRNRNRGGDRITPLTLIERVMEAAGHVTDALK